jgi:hypothetical protein
VKTKSQNYAQAGQKKQESGQCPKPHLKTNQSSSPAEQSEVAVTTKLKRVELPRFNIEGLPRFKNPAKI